ncbi:NADH:flavin oxidoreductase [Modicisalibacter tunisiensis]|uniref:oxidoreductase n=1 Tax=Modicisalibacter tunisiensis TaxID=390637 RepID=UPI000791B15A|nr:NADH:flavin oxidoreductase [Modicisalibacter tunisiensis]KXS37487.1 MAG: morphinone reductase [Halomonadaceae bacterium T82-2]MBZ9539591.1 NADH:flavin oxidoreductase [Modicisalibacter tunisiensis]
MTTSTHSQLFSPVRLKGRELANRAVLAPMTRVSGTAEGHATAAMRDYYRDFAAGGFATLITEGIYTDEAYSQGYLGQPGLANDAQRDSWRPVVEAVHEQGGVFIAQLMHGGAQTQGNRFRDDTAGPSAVAPKGEQLGFYGGQGPYPVPREMSEADIEAVIAGFADAARRAREAGFDGVELHAANGYLLDQFLSTGFNRRSDRWGGSIEGRLALPRAVIRAVRDAVGEDFLVGIRLSQVKVTDPDYRWAGLDEADALLRGVAEEALDYVHLSDIDARAPAFEGTEKSLAALARERVGVPVIANGNLGDPALAEAVLTAGEADLVAVGKLALANRDWPRRVREGLPLTAMDFAMLAPHASLANEAQWRERNGVSATHSDTRETAAPA